MTDQQTKIPKWILIISGFFALLEIGVSFVICTDANSVLENLDVTAKGVDNLLYMWAVRQFALGSIFAFATFKKSVPMLTIAYIFFLVMFAGDLLIGIIQKETPLIFSAVLMCLISIVLLYILNKKK